MIRTATLAALSLLAVVSICSRGGDGSATLSPGTANYKSALATTIEWSKLADFPASATNMSVTSLGGPFSREFLVSFNAPIADIDKWIADSPGTALTPPSISGKTRTFTVSPGGGAQFAEVEVDEREQKVTIRAYWS